MSKVMKTSPPRSLREGDQIKVLDGPFKGSTGLIVGYDLINESLIVETGSEDSMRRISLKREMLESVSDSNLEVLEPLPSVASVLQEGAVAPVYMTCGVMLCLQLTEDGTILTCVPRSNGTSLRKLFEKSYRKSVQSAVRSVLENSFITRLPHIVTIGESSAIFRSL